MSSTSSYPSVYVDCVCTILERFAPTAYRATLPNGKPTVAFVQSKESWLLDILQPGDKVHCTVCPADFERARIRAKYDE